MKIYLSTERSQQRHSHFPLFSHPTDAFYEACHLLNEVEPPTSGFYCSLKGLRTLLDSSTPYAALVDSLQTLTTDDPDLPYDQMADWLENLQWEAAGLPDEPPYPFDDKES